MECKKALMDDDVKGDVDKAMDYLRKKGIAKATNNTRVSAEGLIGLFEDNGVCTMVEVNSETDFVSRNEAFQEFVAKVVLAANKLGTTKEVIDIPELLKQEHQGVSIEGLLGDIVASIRENIVIRRAENFESNNADTLSSSYVHGKMGGDISLDGKVLPIQLGRESSVVSFSIKTPEVINESSRDSLSTAAKRLAMHIVAAKPKYMTVTDIPSSVVEAETAVMREQTMANPPKNASMIDKIVDSKVQKRLSEVCLTGQTHMAVEGAPVIAKHLAQLAKDVGVPALKLKSFKHWSLGQESN